MSLTFIEKLNHADSMGGPGRYTIHEAIARPVEPSDVVAWLLEHGAMEKPSARTERMKAVGQTVFTYSGDVLLVAPGSYIVWKVD